VGRDHTTISRQLAKLESLGLIARPVGGADRRVRAAALTRRGTRSCGDQRGPAATAVAGAGQLDARGSRGSGKAQSTLRRCSGADQRSRDLRRAQQPGDIFGRLAHVQVLAAGEPHPGAALLLLEP